MKAARIDRLPEGGYVVCDGVTGQGVFAAARFDDVVNFLNDKMTTEPDVPITGTGGAAVAAARERFEKGNREIVRDIVRKSASAFADKLKQQSTQEYKFCPDCGAPTDIPCPKNGPCGRSNAINP